MTTSTRMAVVGIRKSPNQKVEVENNISAIPTNTAPTGIVGQILLYKKMKMNQLAMEPQMAACVNRGHEFVTRPALKHTVTTTYCNQSNKTNKLVYVFKIHYSVREYTHGVHHISQNQVSSVLSISPHYLRAICQHW